MSNEKQLWFWSGDVENPLKVNDDSYVIEVGKVENLEWRNGFEGTVVRKSPACIHEKGSTATFVNPVTSILNGEFPEFVRVTREWVNAAYPSREGTWMKNISDVSTGLAIGHEYQVVSVVCDNMLHVTFKDDDGHDQFRPLHHYRILPPES